MTRPRKKGGDGTQVKIADPRIPVCTICRRGIFDITERAWGRGDYLGFVHTYCLKALMKEAA